MRIGSPGKSFECHAYELEIGSLFGKTAVALFSIPESQFKRSHTAKYVEKNLKDFYDHYYKQIGLGEVSVPVVVEGGDPNYNMFLAIALSLLDPFKIVSFLDYHKSKFKGGDFCGIIEHQVYEIMELSIPIENTDRKERIMKWVDEAKKLNPIAKTLHKQKTKEVSLCWNPQFMPALKKLSKRLWKERFTKREGDFQKVFTEGKSIAWLKDADHLCYLLHKLRSHKPPLYKASQGKGHYSLINLYFTDDLGKLARKNYIPDTLYKLKSRNAGKLIPERNAIDLMISYSI